MSTAWTNAEINKAKKLQSIGMKHEDIAKTLGRSFESVRIKLGRVGRGGETFIENKTKGTAEVNAEVPRIMSDKDLLKFLQVDESQWTITKVIYGKSEGYRKDRSVEWDVEQGVVLHGKVRDSGKLLIKPLFSVKIFLEKKINEIATRSEIAELKDELLKYSPKYKTIKYSKVKDGHLYEIAMPDLHLGRLVDEQSAGETSSPDLFVDRTHKAIAELLSIPYKIDRFLFPVGNDLFNSNTSENMTAHGTPQREDPRWQRTYKLAKSLIIQTIETMTQIAPVDVVIVKGNHDEERIFYFGDMLVSQFHNNKNVKIDAGQLGRKYYPYGNVLIGLTHGYYDKDIKLDSRMAQERPDLWARSIFREWHLGHLHHKKDTIIKTDELENGVMVRIFRSLASPSEWEYDKGFGSQKAAEGFLWHKERGLKAQFTAGV
jgi:hypothetical protein